MLLQTLIENVCITRCFFGAIVSYWGVSGIYLNDSLVMMWIWIYRQISNMRSPNPKSQIFLVWSFSCHYPIHWSHVLRREWRCSWGSAWRWSNYIWVKIIILPTKVRLKSEMWWYIYFLNHPMQLLRCRFVVWYIIFARLHIVYSGNQISVRNPFDPIPCSVAALVFWVA